LPRYLVTACGVILLSLTPGGIGVAEATATAMFRMLGVQDAMIVPSSSSIGCSGPTCRR